MAKSKCPNTVGGSMDHAWKCVKGFKAPIWGMFAKFIIPFVIVFIVILQFMGLLVVTPNHPVSHEMIFKQHIISCVINIIWAPLLGALYMLGVKRLRGQEVKKQSIFEYKTQAFNLMLLILIWSIIFTVSAYIDNKLFSNHFGIVSGILTLLLGPAYFISVPLLIEKKLNGFDAFVKAIKYSLSIWHKLIVLCIFAVIIGGLAFLIPIFGWIWLYPFTMLICASIYTFTVEHHKL